MMSRALLFLAFAVAFYSASAARWTLGVPGQGNGSSSSSQQMQQQGVGQGLPAVQPWQPWQQLQQQVLPPTSNGSSSSSSMQQEASSPIKPGTEFVTVSKLERPPELKQAQQQLLKQQQPNISGTFECGKPYMPCGTAIPVGKTCKNGPGWCQPGFFCGFESTTTELSSCLPLPEDCGKAGKPCCPSNTDSPHVSLDDKLNRKPFCRDGSYCFYFAPEPGLNNGDTYAGNKGAYACTAAAPDCGTGPGKPCCPFAHKIATNPQLNRTGCSDGLYCNYDGKPLGIAAVKPEYLPGSMPGTCEANTADCGKFGKSCCIYTTAASTSIACGARWNETGQRGYCADPFDASGGNGLAARPDGRALLAVANSASSSGASNDAANNPAGSSTGPFRRRARYKELVCTPCPARSNDVAENPSKYWPC